MKRILNVSLFLSILACLFYGLDGIFNLDLIASLSLRAPSAAVILKVIFAACGMINILWFSDDAHLKSFDGNPRLPSGQPGRQKKRAA